MKNDFKVIDNEIEKWFILEDEKRLFENEGIDESIFSIENLFLSILGR